MQRFLALGQYYSRYTEGYAKLVAPLRVLEEKAEMGEGGHEGRLTRAGAVRKPSKLD
jgi:hypothetical protein